MSNIPGSYLELPSERKTACPEAYLNPLPNLYRLVKVQPLSANLTPSVARAAILEIAVDLDDMHEEQMVRNRHGYLKHSSCHRDY